MQQSPIQAGPLQVQSNIGLPQVPLYASPNTFANVYPGRHTMANDNTNLQYGQVHMARRSTNVVGQIGMPIVALNALVFGTTIQATGFVPTTPPRGYEQARPFGERVNDQHWGHTSAAIIQPFGQLVKTHAGYDQP